MKLPNNCAYLGCKNEPKDNFNLCNVHSPKVNNDMNDKELLAIRREIQLLKDSREDYVVSTITELEPILELFTKHLKQAELRGASEKLKEICRKHWQLPIPEQTMLDEIKSLESQLEKEKA